MTEINMTDIVLLLLSFGWGAGMGLFYFGGLWLTLRRVPDAHRPKMLLVGSFLVRTGIVLAGFYGVTQVMDTHWEWLALSLLGFMGARLVLVRRWGPSIQANMSNA